MFGAIARTGRRAASSWRGRASAAFLALVGFVVWVVVADPFAAPPHLADLTATRPGYYQIEYQVEQAEGSSITTTWEVLTATGPFDVSDLTYDKAPSSGASPADGSLSTYDAEYDLDNGRLEEVSPQGPALGGGAEALGVELSDLVSRNLARPLHKTMDIAGRSCELVRFSGPPAGPIAPLSGANHDDLCIDQDGLVLSEAWTYNGRVIRRKTAIAVSFTPGGIKLVGPPPLSKAKPLPTSDEIVGVVPDPKEKSFLATPTAPAGYATDPFLGVVQADELDPSLAGDSYIEWAFSSGGNLVTVDAGSGATPWNQGDTPTRSITLAGLGPAQTALTSNGPEIRVSLRNGDWVAVDGTLPLSQLVSYASQLKLAAG